MQTENNALERATSGGITRNYDTIFAGFMLKGIPREDITPRVNVLTYAAWKLKGRQVKRGEHGVKICAFVSMTKTDDSGNRSSFKRPKGTTVFHISQTEPIAN